MTRNEPASLSTLFAENFDNLIASHQVTPFGVSVLDPDLRYVHANTLMGELSGSSVDHLIGRTIREVDPSTASVMEPLLRRALEEGVDLNDIETEVKRTHGETSVSGYWLVSCYPLKGKDGSVLGVGTVVNDITERKLKEVWDERLTFEALLSSLSAAFINISVREVDAKIEQGLKQMVEFLGYDMITIRRVSPDPWRLILTHSYALPGIKPTPTVLTETMMPVWAEMVRKGDLYKISDADDLPDCQWREKQYCREHGGIKSILFIPVSVGGSIVGNMAFVSFSVKKAWPDDLIKRLRVLWEVFANALERKRADEKIHDALAEIERLKNRLEAENLYLRDQIEIHHKYEDIVGQSAAITGVLRKVEQVAATDSTVLILGETGTGKELIASAIHNMSGRKSRSMIKLNCAALPATLIEAELFGREKGAYTGAVTTQTGRFEAADGSTIFLDEIGELPFELQSKLLRVLQDGKLERLGSSKQISVDVRVITATNRDLAQAVKEGRFREDLYYRLNVFPISVPPLRERPEDIPSLTWAIVAEFGKVFGKTIESIPKKNMDALERYDWPGNVRELRNLIERSMILNNSSTLVVELPKVPVTKSAAVKSLEEMERLHIISVLETTGCRIRGKNGAAEILAIKPTTLEAKMKKLGIKRKTVATKG